MSSYRLSRRVVLLLAVLVSVFALSPLSAKPEADSAILFIGDGMGPGQIAMAAGAQGKPLAMQRMPYSGVVSTLAVDGEITDSAAAGTALATGHKTKDGIISMSPGGQAYPTILELSRKRGKSVGVISNDAIWGATPSSFAAHATSRGQYDEIALQMTESRAQVVMGYGQSALLPASAGGKRKDDKNLLTSLKRSGYEVVTDREQLVKAKGTKVVGLFEDGPAAPRLVDAVQAALDRLSTNGKGFFLVVEQARVDWKPGDASGVVADVQELDEAVARAVAFAEKRGRTLVVVTADHETGGCVIDEPAKLGTLGLAKGDADSIAGHFTADRGNVAEVMAQYAGVKDLTPAETTSLKAAKEPGPAVGVVLSTRAGVDWTSNGDHTATPVRVFAYGPGASRFTGSMENAEIPARIGMAMGIVIPAK